MIQVERAERFADGHIEVTVTRSGQSSPETLFFKSGTTVAQVQAALIATARPPQGPEKGVVITEID